MVIIKLQYTTDCALLMMAYLTGEDRVITSRELEESIGFPQQAVFNAGRKLKKHGFVNTINGPFGGYVLARTPEQITVQEILSSFKDEFYFNNQESVRKASMTTLTNLAKKFENAKEEMDRKMSFTLADLLDESA